ncbi:MAG: MFS transporter [Longimicrobiales bacterium]|nr:MFS transporter [Longimicrobiales bacterium]
MNRKHLVAWALYDFANSIYPAVITATVFAVWFANVLVGNEAGLGDWWWGAVGSTSVLFVALTSPILGAVADRSGARKELMALYTLVCVGAVAGFTLLEPGMIRRGFVLAVIANIGFEGALVFYNAWLPEIAPPPMRGRVSGIGFAVGYAGSAVGLALALPLVAAEAYDALWLTVAGFFLLFSIPAFRILPDAPGRGESFGRAMRSGITGFRGVLADVWRERPLRRFLIAFFVYIDGVLTVIWFASIFAATTLGFERIELIWLFLLVQISALAGAVLFAGPTDRWGPRRVITAVLVIWFTLGVLAFFVQTKGQFWGIALVAGLGLGSIQAASRSYMASLIPEGKEAEMFGFYAFCGKASSILGPAIFGTVSRLTGGNQRWAVLAITAFFLVGGVLLQRVEDPVADGPTRRTNSRSP